MELFRRIFRNILGPSSKTYRFGAGFLDFLSIVKKENIETWRALRELQTPNKNLPAQIPITLKSLKHPIIVRPGTADIPVIINNIFREEYGNFAIDYKPSWMVDAGAYIGDTSAYFLSRFQNLKLIALEPNPATFELAVANLKMYGERAIVLNSGLWFEDGKGKICGNFTSASIQDQGLETNLVGVPSLLKQFSIPKIDILKMDIEGAEKHIFMKNHEQWINRIRLLIIELHGKDIKQIVFRVLKRNQFRIQQYRNLWYCTARHTSC